MADTTFYNIWRTANTENRAALLEQMKAEAAALASKAGFVSLTVLECAEDGRVLVEGRWQSKEAFEAGVADDPETQKSRASLEKFGSAEPGLFTEAFRVGSASMERSAGPAPQTSISARSGLVTFVQIWRMNSAEHQRQWLKTMHSHIGLLRVQPGFVSMSLHTSLDGKQTAVYAQWADETSFTQAIELPEAKEAHTEMAKWGEAEGLSYRVDSVYLPAMPSVSQPSASKQLFTKQKENEA